MLRLQDYIDLKALKAHCMSADESIQAMRRLLASMSFQELYVLLMKEDK